MENELQELDLNTNLVTAEGGESEELETDNELEFNPAELTDEELEFELSEESEGEQETEEQLEDVEHNELLNSGELDINLEETNLNTEEIPVEETTSEDELELSPELDVELEETNLQNEIREDVTKKTNFMNIEELKDTDLELEMSLS